MISLCIATRGRPEVFKQTCLSAIETASDPNDIEFVSYHDNDDTSVYEYMGNHREVTGERSMLTLTQMFNECQKIASGHIYFFLGDDYVFKTKGWDNKIKETFEQYPDKIVLVCPDNDEWLRWKFGTIVCIHKNWVDAIGYAIPPYPYAQSSDRWMNEVALSIGRMVHLLDVKIEHLNIRDHVHKEKNQKGRESQQTKRYYLPEMADIRKKEAKLLQDFIKNFT